MNGVGDVPARRELVGVYAQFIFQNQTVQNRNVERIVGGAFVGVHRALRIVGAQDEQVALASQMQADFRRATFAAQSVVERFGAAVYWLDIKVFGQSFGQSRDLRGNQRF